jgi:hypothetical protein
MHMAANTKANPPFKKNTVAPASVLRSWKETPGDPYMADAGSSSLAEVEALSAKDQSNQRKRSWRCRMKMLMHDPSAFMHRLLDKSQKRAEKRHE